MTECTHDNTKCINSRPIGKGYRRRRYKCLDCDKRFSSIEIPVHRDNDFMRKLVEAVGNMALLSNLELYAVRAIITVFLDNKD